MEILPLSQSMEDKSVGKISVESFETILQSEDMRGRIISVVRDSTKIDERIASICKKEIHSFETNDFGSTLVRSLGHDDNQKAVFKAWAKGGLWWIIVSTPVLIFGFIQIITLVIEYVPKLAGG